jgi:hypothetical protein
MSLNESPCTAKLDTRAVKLEVGEGINVLAAVMLAVRESLLPSPTFQEGPPNCKRKHVHPLRIIYIYIYIYHILPKQLYIDG